MKGKKEIQPAEAFLPSALHAPDGEGCQLTSQFSGATRQAGPEACKIAFSVALQRRRSSSSSTVGFPPACQRDTQLLPTLFAIAPLFLPPPSPNAFKVGEFHLSRV